MEPSEAEVGLPNLSGLVRAGIDRLRAKLLDLSMANRLLNFKHSEKSRTHIRVVDEIPEVLFGKLEDAKNLLFAWIDEPDSEPADERAPEFREALAGRKERDEKYLEERQKLRHGGTKRQISKLDRALRDRIRILKSKLFFIATTWIQNSRQFVRATEL